MAEVVGYGASSAVGLGPGYGDPSSVGLGPGYGDPSSVLALAPVIVGQQVFSDYGGDIVTMTGSYGAGPYWARLLDAGGGVHPSIGFAWSGVPGDGPLCYPWSVGDTLQFVLPAVEPAIYSVRLYFDAEATTWTDSANSLEVKRRTYAQATYRMRNAYPSSWLGPGPRRVRDEHQP